MAKYNIYDNTDMLKIQSGRVNDSFFAENGEVDLETYYSKLGYNLIYLQPNLAYYNHTDRNMFQSMINSKVIALLMDDINFSISSEWETSEYPKIFSLGFIATFFERAGGGEMGAYFRSKKFWKKSGYLNLNPRIRVIDVQGSGAPLQAVQTLLLYCVSGGSISFAEALGADESIMQNIEDFANAGVDTLVDFLSKLNAPDGSETGALAPLARTMGNMVKDTYVRDWDNFTSLQFSPPSLIVRIGKYFTHSDMVLQNMSFTFSRECTDAGPMYVDITLELSSRQIISDFSTVGMMNTPDTGRSRITYSLQGETLTVTTAGGETGTRQLGLL